ncbi:Oxalate--CoA ligase [Hibiscus syriacus]|uniref:Oxalate--CoA ligase n=1 Tax=Hibiscus syriacus TaxID=106335 RepID=A0A6A3CKU3_HIBSY|nr:Oxalate--CoA ligase [Hibiscus syriacus]
MEIVTLTGLLNRAAAEFPNRRALSVSGKFYLTHAQLQRLIDHAASLLVASGILPGDVVALTFPNTVELVIMFLAVIRCRATAAPLNPAYTAEEFEFYLSDSESKLLLIPTEGIKAAEAAASKLNVPLVSVTLKDENSKINLSSNPDSNLDSVHQLVTDPADMALFLHTSGTTSRPKGVPLTQLNLGTSVWNIKSVYELTESDSTVIVLPLFHVHGLLAGLLSSLVSGAAVTLPAADHIGPPREQARGGVPKVKVHQKLQRVFSAEHIRAAKGGVRRTGTRGLRHDREASHLMASNPLPTSGPNKAGSVGKPVGQEMAILNEQGEVQPPHSNGEVCIRGLNVTKGYKNNPEANKSAFQFGWFHTGDIGYLDSDGYLHLVGRIKELINRGGEKISPIEVDAVLLGHPNVAQAVAFGVPDEKYGEEINCAVIPKEGVNLEEADVTEYSKKNLASFKVPKKVFVTDFLPKTDSNRQNPAEDCSRAFLGSSVGR